VIPSYQRFFSVSFLKSHVATIAFFFFKKKKMFNGMKKFLNKDRIKIIIDGSPFYEDSLEGEMIFSK
jgi:hypothetical protein